MDKEIVPHCLGIFLIDLDKRVRSVMKYGPNTGIIISDPYNNTHLYARAHRTHMHTHTLGWVSFHYLALYVL